MFWHMQLTAAARGNSSRAAGQLELPVSVVIPAFNRAHLLPRAIASIRAQNGVRPAEIIVVDDASSDDTAAVASRLAARVVRHEVNRGPSAARNTGFAAAHTPWLIQMDSDDAWLPDCLATLWSLRSSHVLISGACVSDEATPRYNGVHGRRAREVRSPAALVFPDNHISASAALMSADAVRRVGGYRTDLHYAEDLELWLRLLETGTAIVTPVPVTTYHRHAEQAVAEPGKAHVGHRQVMEMSVDRDWWTDSLAVRWSAIPAWDAVRGAIRQRNLRRLAGAVTTLFARPQRTRGLAEILVFRWRSRRSAAHYQRGSAIT
jgi:glycosyltransferase involved in cell wall biosynthesis